MTKIPIYQINAFIDFLSLLANVMEAPAAPYNAMGGGGIEPVWRWRDTADCSSKEHFYFDAANV